MKQIKQQTVKRIKRPHQDDLAFAAEWLRTYDDADVDTGGTARVLRVARWLEELVTEAYIDARIKEAGLTKAESKVLRQRLKSMYVTQVVDSTT